MPEPQDDGRYTPCWTIVPISGKDAPKTMPEPDDDDSSQPVEHALFWIVVAWGALGIYEIIKEML